MRVFNSMTKILFVLVCLQLSSAIGATVSHRRPRASEAASGGRPLSPAAQRGHPLSSGTADSPRSPRASDISRADTRLRLVSFFFFPVSYMFVYAFNLSDCKTINLSDCKIIFCIRVWTAWYCFHFFALLLQITASPTHNLRQPTAFTSPQPWPTHSFSFDTDVTLSHS